MLAAVVRLDPSRLVTNRSGPVSGSRNWLRWIRPGRSGFRRVRAVVAKTIVRVGDEPVHRTGSRYLEQVRPHRLVSHLQRLHHTVYRPGEPLELIL